MTRITLYIFLIETDLGHAGDMFTLVTDARVTQFYHVVPLKEEQDMHRVIDWLKSRYEDRLGIRWAIALKDQKQIIGTIGFNSITDRHKATVVYALRPEYWNKGYTTEAIKAVLRFGFEELWLNRIEAEVMPGNVSSVKVLAKTGFSYEGLLRQWTLWNGVYFDMNMYAILASEFASEEHVVV
jgi:ribosomal-protein-alanine N-acetyltransferase